MSNSNSKWKNIESPLFKWVPGFERIISSYELPEFSGDTIYIVSDYGGIPSKSKYFTISILYMDLEASKKWELQRRIVRGKFLPDGRRMSFKGLSDKKKSLALVPFLEATNEIAGVNVSIAIHKEALNVTCDLELYKMILNDSRLKGKWSFKAYENAMRISHFVSLLIGGFSRPGQDVYWISDEDGIFDNPGKTEDVRMLSSAFTSRYVTHELGNLGMGTTKMDEGDLFEEDLASIPDLAAGAINEILETLYGFSGGPIPLRVGIPFNENFSEKTNIIARWMFSERIKLKNIIVLIEPDIGKKTRISKFNLEDAPSIIHPI